MWDELKCPVVPVVTYGAFDLYPRGSIISNTGHVRMRYLKPIMPNEAKSKDEMSALIRRRMLEAMKQCPEDIGHPLTWVEKLVSVLTILSLFVVDMKLYQFTCKLAFDYAKLTTKQFSMLFVVFSGVVTLSLYFYYTEVVHWKNGGKKQANAEAKKGKCLKKYQFPIITYSTIFRFVCRKIIDVFLLYKPEQFVSLAWDFIGWRYG